MLNFSDFPEAFLKSQSGYYRLLSFKQYGDYVIRFRGRRFVQCLVILERLIFISNLGTLKFDDKCLIPPLKLSPQGMTTTEYQRKIKLICIVGLRFTSQNSDFRP